MKLTPSSSAARMKPRGTRGSVDMYFPHCAAPHAGCKSGQQDRRFLQPL
jgi:hypothetical protein